MQAIRVLGIIVLFFSLVNLAYSQAPPSPNPPVAPKTEQLDPKACANSDTHDTTGKGGDKRDLDTRSNEDLSDKLAQSGGVICPPAHVDPEIRQPTPRGGTMKVIPPPGSPGGDQSVQPK
ncbi:MAG TPA: hypothetical protein VFP60_13570 [Pseudolabrys sp.]|nr:hypothetical protein [Pseudolabrys sp.]